MKPTDGTIPTARATTGAGTVERRGRPTIRKKDASFSDDPQCLRGTDVQQGNADVSGRR